MPQGDRPKQKALWKERATGDELNAAVLRAREAALEYISENKISNAEFSRRVGVSQSTMSEFLSGTYGGRMDQVAEKIMAVVGERADTTALYIPIKNYKRVHEVLRRTKAKQEFSVIVGPPGLGKTTAVKAWREQDDDAVYIRITGVHTKSSLLKELGRKLGQVMIRDGNANNFSIVNGAIREREGKCLVIVDEADRLSIPMLELLRDLYDKSQCSMVLIGLERFLITLQTGRTQKENLAQLYSRVWVMRKLTDLDTEDVTLVFEHHGVKRMDKETLTFVTDKIRNRGGIRTLTKVIGHSLELSEKNSEPVNGKMIRSSFQYLVKGLE